VFLEDKSLIPPENYYEMRYEDFIQNPIPYLKEIYEKFEIGDFERVEPLFQEYIKEKKDYKANNYVITPRIVRLVNRHWNKYRVTFGYDRLEPSQMAESSHQIKTKYKI
jgi:hypothetical protein